MYVLYGKRLTDVTFSILLLALTAWIIVLIFLTYFLAGQAEVIFRHSRIGQGEKIFTLYKFRTLSPGNNDVKVQPFWLGSVLRFFSLDELPQLLNVLKGDMSLIGPRPLPIEYLPLFSRRQRQRHSMRPGITGWAQVNGRHTISWPRKFEYDLYYVNNVSVWLDLQIVAKTILLLLSFRKDVSLQEKKFTGEEA